MNSTDNLSSFTTPQFMSVIRSQKLLLQLSWSASATEIQKKWREFHLNVSLGQCLSLDRCFWVQVKDLEGHEKCFSKKDQKRQYSPHVISIGWAQIPPQAQLEGEQTHTHTNMLWKRHGETEGRETEKLLVEGHFQWLGSDPSQAKVKNANSQTGTQHKYTDRQTGR